jgi:serine protease
LFKRWVAVFVGIAAAGCDPTKEAPTQGPRYTVSGIVHAAPGNVADVDVGNPDAPAGNNNDFAHAQALPSLVTVGGWSGTTDQKDVYRAKLAAGQVVTLAVADPAVADLDLYLYDVGVTDRPAASSIGASGTHSLVVPAGAEYYVAVSAASGSSNYTLTIGVGPAAAVAPGALDVASDFVPGQVIVRFRDDALVAAAVDTVAARAASMSLVARSGGPRREMLMELPAGAAVRAAALAANGARASAVGPLGELVVDDLLRERWDTLALVAALRRRADVASADLNYVRRAFAVPDDKRYGLQWDLPLMNLPQAWEVTKGAPASGNPDVVVAVVDTGVLLRHPDLAGKLVAGYDFVSDPTAARDGDGLDADPTDPGSSPSPGRSVWHGTHVAGTIGAASNNGVGVAGVSWGAKIMPLRALGLNGEGTSYDVLQAVRFAAGLTNDSHTTPARKADVINLSLGGPGASATEQQLYDQVRAAGAIVVAAAGNEDTTELFYPASYRGVISVSAVDAQRQRAPYSNRGTAVDVAAPGGDSTARLNGYPAGILSTYGDDSSGTLQMVYGFLQGTSMAAPHVAGVVALMRAVCRTLTPDLMDVALASGAITTDLGAPGRDDVYGYGLIDAYKAVAWASDPTNCASTTGALTSILVATPARVDFAPSATAPVGLRLEKIGPDAVTSVAVSGAPAWVTVTPPAASDGLGAYVLTPKVAGLPEGAYAGSVVFTATLAAGATRSAVVPVTLQVGVSATTPSAGYLYVLLVDAASDQVVDVVGKSATAGDYPFTFSGVPAGRYHVYAGSDSNNRGDVCDAGESCGAYPTLARPTAVDPAKPPASLSFQVGFTAALGAADAAPAGLPLEGALPRLPLPRTPAVLP